MGEYRGRWLTLGTSKIRKTTNMTSQETERYDWWQVELHQTHVNDGSADLELKGNVIMGHKSYQIELLWKIWKSLVTGKMSPTPTSHPTNGSLVNSWRDQVDQGSPDFYEGRFVGDIQKLKIFQDWMKSMIQSLLLNEYVWAYLIGPDWYGLHDYAVYSMIRKVWLFFCCWSGHL